MAVSETAKLKIGVLAPSSNFVPSLASDMLKSFEKGLSQAQLDAEIVVASAGYNADIKTIVPAIQQLILERRVKCIIAPLNISVIESIGGQCENQEVPLIALNLTEDPVFETARNPFVFVNDFHLWHSAWMSGYLAAKRFGARGAVLAAMHESGYGLAFAFQLGLEAAQGTSVSLKITHRHSSTEDSSADIAAAVAQNPDFIWAAYSGKEAVSFLKAFASSGSKDKIPVVTIAPMVSQNIRRNADGDIRGIWYVTGENYRDWSSARNALDSLTAAIGREPNPYALLAYESAQLIAAAVKNINDAENFGESLVNALRASQIETSRGIIKFNNPYADDAFYLRQITADGETVEKITAPPLLHEQFRLACRKLTKQGWKNPYLCA